MDHDQVGNQVFDCASQTHTWLMVLTQEYVEMFQLFVASLLTFEEAFLILEQQCEGFNG